MKGFFSKIALVLFGWLCYFPKKWKARVERAEDERVARESAYRAVRALTEHGSGPDGERLKRPPVLHPRREFRL
jgi:hypothetical protein